MGKGQVHSEGITLFLSRVPDGTQRGLNRSTNPAINRWATIGRPFGTVHARYDSAELALQCLRNVKNSLTG